MTQRQTVTPMWVSLCGRFNVWLQTHNSPRCLCPSAAELRPLTNTLGLQLMLACVRAEGGANTQSLQWRVGGAAKACHANIRQANILQGENHAFSLWSNLTQLKVVYSKRSSCRSDLTLKHTLDWSSSQKNIILFSTLLDIAWQQE